MRPTPEAPVRRLWTPYTPVEFRVRCERRMHRIRIDQTGRLVLVDHDMELEALAEALGGDEMRCPAVVGFFKEAVKRGLMGRLPDKARPHVHALRERRYTRSAYTAERRALSWTAPLLASVDPDPATGAPAAVYRTKDAYMARYVRRLLAASRVATAHPQGTSPFATPHTVQVSWVAAQRLPQELHLEVQGRTGFGNRTALRGAVHLHQRWWQRVHKAGLDLVDGRLVLDAPSLPEAAGGVLYSFAGMTPRARKKARRAAAAGSPVRQLPLPDVMGETRTATVCVLGDPLPLRGESDRWTLRLPCLWYDAVAERGAPWRLEKPVEPWRIPKG